MITFVAYEFNRDEADFVNRMDSLVKVYDTGVVVLRYMRVFEGEDMESVIFRVSLVFKEF